MLIVLAAVALISGSIWYAIYNWLLATIFPSLPYLNFWKCLLLGLLVNLVLRPSVTIKK